MVEDGQNNALEQSLNHLYSGSIYGLFSISVCLLVNAFELVMGNTSKVKIIVFIVLPSFYVII